MNKKTVAIEQLKKPRTNDRKAAERNWYSHERRAASGWTGCRVSPHLRKKSGEDNPGLLLSVFPRRSIEK